MPSAASLLPLACDSVSQLADRASVSITGGTAVEIGSLVIVSVTNVTVTSKVGRTLGTVPSGMRPSRLMVGSINYNNNAGQITVDGDGIVSVYSTASGDFSGQVVYTV